MEYFRYAVPWRQHLLIRCHGGPNFSSALCSPKAETRWWLKLSSVDNPFPSIRRENKQKKKKSYWGQWNHALNATARHHLISTALKQEKHAIQVVALAHCTIPTVISLLKNLNVNKYACHISVRTYPCTWGPMPFRYFIDHNTESEPQNCEVTCVYHNTVLWHHLRKWSIVNQGPLVLTHNALLNPQKEFIWGRF